MQNKTIKILGIDPGYGRLGIAVIEKNGSHNKETLLHSECFTTEGDIYDRLAEIGSRIKATIEQYKPDILAMETLFITKNQKTAMHVAEVRGIIAYEARLHGMPITEYSPPQIKASVTGNGASDKSSIIKMVPLLIKIDATTKRHDDEYDAIAVALTCSAHHRQ